MILHESKSYFPSSGILNHNYFHLKEFCANDSNDPTEVVVITITRYFENENDGFL